MAVFEPIDKTQKVKENFADKHFHNIFRLFDVLPNFPFTKNAQLLLIHMV